MGVGIKQEVRCNFCSRTFPNRIQFGKHRMKAHKGVRFQCGSCNKSYTRATHLREHEELKHGSEINKRYPCGTCGKSFTRPDNAQAHERDQHKSSSNRKRWTCGNCATSFTHSCTLRLHKLEVHATNPKQHICMICCKSFSRASNLRRHERGVHAPNRKQYPCQYCSSTFTQLSSARRHERNSHLGQIKTFSCQPCAKIFRSNAALQLHLNGIHKGIRYPCPKCPKSYSGKPNLKTHITGQHDLRCFCPLPTCRYVVSGRGHTKRDIKKHMAAHEKFGHLVGLDNPSPTRRDLPKEVEGNQAELEYWYSVIFEESSETARRYFGPVDGKFERYDENKDQPREDKDNLSVDHLHPHSVRLRPRQIRLNQSREHEDELSEDEVEFRGYGDEISEEGDEIGEDVDELGGDEDGEEDEPDYFLSPYPDLENMSEIHDLTADDTGPDSLLQRNLTIVKRLGSKIWFRNNGLSCIGFGLVDGLLVSHHCPTGVTIGLKTARLVLKTTGGTVNPCLSPRCIVCEAQHNLLLFLGGNAEHAGSNTHSICGCPSCLKPTWAGSGFCFRHLVGHPSIAPPGHIDEQWLEAATSYRWVASFVMEQIFQQFDDILTGILPPGALMSLDLEYDVYTRRIYEVGMCDALGNIAADCSTLLSDAEIKRTSGGLTWTNALRVFSAVIRKTARSHQHVHGRMDVHQLANQLQKAGITPETTVLVWGVNRSDLRSLREWFEAEGYDNILPPNSKCVTLLWHFQKNLKSLANGKSITLRLPALFPLFHGIRHELSGRNHHALIDAQQTLLMFQSLKALCMDVSERGESWAFNDSAGVRQRSIQDFYSIELSAENVDPGLL